MLKRQTSLDVYRLPTKDNKPPCSVFRLQKQTNGSLPFSFSVYIYVYIYIYIYIYKYIYIYIRCRFIRKRKDRAIFLNPFTVCSSCKRQFVVLSICLRRNKRKLPVCKRTKRSCPSMIKKQSSQKGIEEIPYNY